MEERVDQVEHERVAQPEINLGREREYETGKDEAWFANIKRTYDEFQQESLETIRQHRSFAAKVLYDAQQNDQVRQNIANQALQNAVETANMVSKQTVRHSENVVETCNMTGKQANRHADIAIDRQWNVDEQGFTVNEILADEAFKNGISAAVTNAINAAWSSATQKD
jgi:hypothetical protein